MKIIKSIAQLRIYLGNGQAYFNDFKYPVMLAIALKVWFPTTNIINLLLIAILMMLILAFLGWFDLKYIKLAQTQAEIATGKYNPYFSKLKKRFK